MAKVKEPKLKTPQVKVPKEPKSPEEPRLAAPTPPIEEDRLQPPAAMPSNQEDYLRQYQVRKQTRPGTTESDPPVGSKAETMKKFLLSQSKVRFFIPRFQGEDVSVKQSVCLNGYRLEFPKQAYLDIPEAVANVLMESLKQTEEAVQRNRIDGNKAKETALL